MRSAGTDTVRLVLASQDEMPLVSCLGASKYMGQWEPANSPRLWLKLKPMYFQSTTSLSTGCYVMYFISHILILHDYVPDAILSALQTCSHLILTMTF